MKKLIDNIRMELWRLRFSGMNWPTLMQEILACIVYNEDKKLRDILKILEDRGSESTFEMLLNETVTMLPTEDAKKWPCVQCKIEAAQEIERMAELVGKVVHDRDALARREIEYKNQIRRLVSGTHCQN